MAKDYSGLTGGELLAGIRKTHRARIAADIFAILFAAAFLIGCVIMLMNNRRDAFRIVMSVIGIAGCILGVWALFGQIGKHIETIARPENCRLFRKYGTPDAKAARIAAESGEPVIAEKSTLLCRSFIMIRGDFESFIPLDKMLHVYRKESSTNGIKHSVYLVGQDIYGDKFEYPFKLGKTHKQVMVNAMEEISRQSPQCAVGYSPGNIAYAKQHITELPAEGGTPPQAAGQ